FRVMEPEAAVIKVENFLKATSLIAQTTLRSVLGQAELDELLSHRDTLKPTCLTSQPTLGGVLGQAELDELLSHRDKINLTLQNIIDRQTDPWGIKVTAVEVKDVVLPDSMKRARERQPESERERRAKVINAEGEF